MKFYILTSTNLYALTRHFNKDYSNIQIEDAVVVINSLDKKYIKKAKRFCVEKEIEHYVTESNGTPAVGKNSLLDIFLESDNDYCVMIDGDDFLTPHGVWMYKNLENSDTPPDAVCLINQQSFINVDDILYSTQPFTVNYGKLLNSDYYTMFKNTYGLSSEKATYFQSLHYKFYSQHRKYSQDYEVHCRVTWLSKKAAQFKFNEKLVIGEDTLQMFELKNQAVLGNIKFCTTDEKPATYVYDERNVGTVVTQSKYGSDYEWMDAYLNELKKMERGNKLHENVRLPELKIDYPLNYSKGDYKLTDEHVHKINNLNVKLPRNASDTSIKKYYHYFKALVA
mgnify:CR=1 FL=1|tara:strand:+ start:972 stop:1985 length:1014 start_codon:yes stop_codon:yes gene_type:complete